MKLRLAAALLAAASCGAAIAQEVVTPPPALVLENVPPIPAEVAQKVKPYEEFRPHALASWHPVRREVLVRRRLTATFQVHRVAEPGAAPQALTDYIRGRQGYDYSEHGRAGNTHTDFVPDEIVDRFCLLGPVEAHLEKLQQLRDLGVDQFALYLQHDDKENTHQAYGEKIIPALASAPLSP